ncbi:class I SAM-dependent methyltransferase [Microbacterium aurugineum]
MSTTVASEARIRDAYAARAAEYTGRLGDIGQMDAVDRQCIATWSDGIDGRICDAGCGPGHWTAFLAERGHDVEGIDLVPEFIASASARFPHVRYRVASLADADVEPGSLGGVLAWYSLIHAGPEALPVLFSAIRRALHSGGGLLVGFFDGPDGEPFPHAVTSAYLWSIPGLTLLLERAGFSVVDCDARVQDGRRPHASISAIAV